MFYQGYKFDCFLITYMCSDFKSRTLTVKRDNLSSVKRYSIINMPFNVGQICIHSHGFDVIRNTTKFILLSQRVFNHPVDDQVYYKTAALRQSSWKDS